VRRGTTPTRCRYVVCVCVLTVFLSSSALGRVAATTSRHSASTTEASSVAICWLVMVQNNTSGTSRTIDGRMLDVDYTRGYRHRRSSLVTSVSPTIVCCDGRRCSSVHRRSGSTQPHIAGRGGPFVLTRSQPTSVLCEERHCEHLDGDALAKLYDDTINSFLDKQILVQVTCRRRS